MESAILLSSNDAHLNCCESANFFRGYIIGQYRKSAVLINSLRNGDPEVERLLDLTLVDLKEVEKLTTSLLNRLASGDCDSCFEAAKTLAIVSQFHNLIVAQGAPALATPDKYLRGLKALKNAVIRSIEFICEIACGKTCVSGDSKCAISVLRALGYFYRLVDFSTNRNIEFIEAFPKFIYVLTTGLYQLFKRKTCCSGTAEGMGIMGAMSLNALAVLPQGSDLSAYVEKYKKDVKAMLCSSSA